MRQYPESNNITEIKKAFRAVYRLISCIRANEFEFLYGTGDPVEEPSSQKSIYINTDDNGLWEWQTSAWVFITYLGGAGGLQDLQSVLDQGHSAVNQIIELFGNDSYINVYATDNVVTSSFGVDTEPYILLTNSLGYKIILRAALVSGNTVEFPANSGTLALLSDIPPATPTVISTKTTTYTLQLADADFDTLFEMDAATDEDFIVDSAEAFPIGTSFIFARRGAGEVNIVAAGATVILSANGATNLTYQDSGATLIKVSATEWYLFGDIGTPNTTTPGGNDRELQFNDGGTAFGGATGFTYDPTNTNGLVELVSTDDTKSIMSIQGPSTSSNIFEVSHEANPGVGNYFIVGANQGFMAGIWTISNGGELNISTGSLGVSDMFKLTNAAGSRNIALSLSDDNTFAIRDTVAAVNRIEISPTGDIAIKALDTDSSAPSTTGTVKMVVCDNTGKLSNKPDPKPYLVIVGNLTQTGTNVPVFTIFENTTGVTYTMGYTGVGLYTLTANSGTPFTANKTQVYIGGNIATVGGDNYFMNTSINSTTVIGISSGSYGIGFNDDILSNTPIEIRIYP
jgi:hypothetical protein